MKELSARDGLAGVRSYGKRRSKKSLYSLPRVGTTILSSLLAVAGCFSQASVIAQTVSSNAQASPAALRDGQHDFDFNIGVWHTRIRRLVHPLTGSNEWVELDGTVRSRKVWNGRAQLEELDAHGASGQLQGLTLFLYNPDAHQWCQYFANREGGVLNRPLIGEFKHGQGELFDQESFHGRTVLTRFVWSDISADSHHVEESYSDDGGETWEPHFIATVTRETAASTLGNNNWTSSARPIDGARDFDFNFGEWKTHIPSAKAAA